MKVTIRLIMSYVLVLSLLLITGCANNTPRDSNEGTTSENLNTNSSTSSELISSASSAMSSTQPSETSSKKTNVKENISDSNHNISSKPATSKDNESKTTSSKNNSSKETSSKNTSSKANTTSKKVVQKADPETGVSWDGKSPIIYTYPDGTTGTEKRDGAKYEYLPGMYNEIDLPKDGVGRLLGSTCSICNKTVGQGYYPNSCEQFSRSQYCIYCGVYITDHTCHSCPPNTSTYYCSKCGKTEGDGKNGTCVQWLMGDVDCPNCGAHVTVRTCHTCTK